jgi:5-methylcytosine-specific restriction endonuclease McrA
VKKTCRACRRSLSLELFYRYASGYYHFVCNPCRVEQAKQKRRSAGIAERPCSTIRGKRKLCMQCRGMKHLREFHPSARGLGGVEAYCKECRSIRYKDSERSRRYTAAYRARHREHHLALHRLHQFKRRHQKEASADGSVTLEVLQRVYTSEVCSYCCEDVMPKDRTLDHVVPLARGGAHTADNVTMACKRCNSSKRDQDLDTFLKGIYGVPSEDTGRFRESRRG